MVKKIPICGTPSPMTHQMSIVEKSWYDCAIIRGTQSSHEFQGFNRIVDNPVYNMFRPEELQQIVVGAIVIDWKQIEHNAKYHEGLLMR